MPSHFSVAIALNPIRLSVAVFDSHSRDVPILLLLQDLIRLVFRIWQPISILCWTGMDYPNGSMKGADIILIASVVAE